MISGIPRSRNSIARPSTGISSQFGSKSNIAPGSALRPSKKVNSGLENTPIKGESFKKEPRSKDLNERILPIKLRGRPRIIDNDEQIECLYEYVKNIAHEYFDPVSMKALFPKDLHPKYAARLSFLSNQSRDSISSTSHIPIFRRSSILSEADLNDETEERASSLSKGFALLKSRIVSMPKKMIALSDFCMLYCSIVIAISDTKNAKMTLSFLLEFFKLSITRVQEMGILFAVLLRVASAKSELREESVQIMGSLALSNQEILTRLQNGVSSEKFGAVCAESLSLIGVEVKIEKRKATFNMVDEASAIDSISKFIDLLEDSSQLEDVSFFVRNMIEAMYKFNSSSSLLERAATCLEFFIQDCSLIQIPLDIAYKCLSVCISIHCGDIFLSGDKCIEAQEAIKKLISAIFNNLQSTILLEALAAIIMKSNEEKITSVLSLLCDHIKYSNKLFTDDELKIINVTIHTYHPNYNSSFDFLPQTYSFLYKILDSFGRLTRLDSSEMLNEIVTCIMESPNGNFDGYPFKLQQFLRSVWKESQKMDSLQNPDQIMLIVNDIIDEF